MIEGRSAEFLRKLFNESADAHDGDYPDKVDAGILAVYDCGRREEKYINGQSAPSEIRAIVPMEAILGAVARGWCSPENSHKVMDSDLASAIAVEVSKALTQEPRLEDIEQYRLQMAGISTAAFGYWKEGEAIHPDYDTQALRDVAKLYAKYDALFREKANLSAIEPKVTGINLVRRMRDQRDEIYDAAMAVLREPTSDAARLALRHACVKVPDYRQRLDNIFAALIEDAAAPAAAQPQEPVAMVMYCPRCQFQHVDAEEPHPPTCGIYHYADDLAECDCGRWTNPPHSTHTCQKCGLNWRPSNALTVGVANIVVQEPKHLERIESTNPAKFAAPTEAAAHPGQEAVRDDLAMLVRRLAARIKLRAKSGPHATPDNALADQATDYLHRKGLLGSILRDEPGLTNGDDREKFMNKERNDG